MQQAAIMPNRKSSVHHICKRDANNQGKLMRSIAYSTVGAARQSAFQILRALSSQRGGDVVAIPSS
eukprot:scaffold8007_cov78-Skeletonema_dohrnii-CCMP3373.AAC.2